MGLVQTSPDIGLKMPHQFYVKHMVIWWMANQLKHDQNHFFVGCCWGLNFTHMVQNHAHLRLSDAFSAQGGNKNTQKCQRKWLTGQTAFLEACSYGSCHFTQSWIWVWKTTLTQILKFETSIPEIKKPALEVLRCRSLSLNNEWICMNYWLMWIHFRWIFLTSSGHLQKYDKVLVVDTCNRKEPWWTNTSAPSFQIWTYPDTFWPSTHLNKI